MRLLIVLLMSALSLSVVAADRTAKVRALMEAQGLLVMWDQQLAMGKQQGQQQAQQILDQVLAGLNPPPEFDAKFRDVMAEYQKDLDAPWTAQDIVDVWAQKYGARFTDAELDGLLSYYTSPLGRKDVAATQAAMPEFMNHFTEQYKPVMDKATTTYVMNLQKLVQACRCQKK